MIMIAHQVPHIMIIVASLDKALNVNYLCLVASNKQQINLKEGRKQPEHI